jgi:hypothetical protein
MAILRAVAFSILAAASAAFGAQSVTLQWDPNVEADVSSYIVYYGTSSRNYASSTNVGNVTTATVSGLADGKAWYFAIAARNNNGLESDFSNEVTNAAPAIATNRPPTVSTIGDVSMRQSGYTNVPFTVWDVETFPGDLTVTADSSNPSLIPLSGLTVTGANWDRVLHIEPNPLVDGVSLISVVVSDGSKAASTSFLVTVLPIPTPPARLLFISKMQVANSPTGPWSTVLTTILPVDIDGGPVRFYRTWVDLKP